MSARISTPEDPTNRDDGFFFAREVPYGLALVRIFLPLAVMIPMLMRARRVRELFSTDGAPLPLTVVDGWGDVLPVFPAGVAIPLYGIMLACLLMAVVGFRTRLSLVIATPLYIYFNVLDSVSTLTKYSVIASHLLVLLTVSQCGAVWSVDAVLDRRRKSYRLPPAFPVWPARLMQLLFACVYFGAAITKLQTAGFFSGAQLRYWMLSNWNYDNPIGESLALWTPGLLVGAYLTILWEVLFCTLVWQPRTRIPMLLGGVAFHLLTALTLGLYIFPAICLAGYFAFLTERDIIWLRQCVTSSVVAWPFRQVDRLVAVMTRLAEPGAPAVRTSLSVPAGLVWLCIAGVTAIGLAEFEVQADLYGMAVTENGHPLTPLDSSVAREMIQHERRVREQDKFFDFAIGTYTVGYQLANRCDEFTYGDTLLAQCNLNPPHEDLWVECVLQDEAGRTIEQIGQFVTRESLRADFPYLLGDKLVPGRYQMVLKSSNQEIASRPFTLTGSPSTVSDVFTN